MQQKTRQQQQLPALLQAETVSAAAAAVAGAAVNGNQLSISKSFSPLPSSSPTACLPFKL